MITTTAFGQQSETVCLDGVEVGQISGNDDLWFAQPHCRAGSYRFGSHDNAVAACVSYAKFRYWENEI